MALEEQVFMEYGPSIWTSDYQIYPQYTYCVYSRVSERMFTSTERFQNERAFRKCLNKWNNDSPNHWRYWAEGEETMPTAPNFTLTAEERAAIRGSSIRNGTDVINETADFLSQRYENAKRYKIEGMKNGESFTISNPNELAGGWPKAEADRFVQHQRYSGVRYTVTLI